MPVFSFILKTLMFYAAFFLCLSKIVLMKKLFLIILLSCYLSAETNAQNSNETNYTAQFFELHLNVGIRALFAYDDETCWFASNNGIYGFTEDGGLHWQTDTLKIDTLLPEFRAIAMLDKKTVLLMCIGSPAYILKTTDKGKTWRKVYTNTGAQIFLDAMKFADRKTGIVAGDPIDSCFTILKTNDEGENWRSVNCSAIPLAAKDEAFFASSNSNIDIVGNNVWIVSGGNITRILFSDDLGENWTIFNTPIISGVPMKGAYTMDFNTAAVGIIAGGDYDNKSNTTANKATTTDGGKTWKILGNTDGPGFISCIQYRPKSDAKTIVASCLPDVYISDDGGINWSILLSKVSFYTFRFSPSGKVIWFAGSKGQLARIKL